MIKEVLPIVYKNLLKYLIFHKLPSTALFSVLPVLDQTKENWLPLLEPLYKNFLCNIDIFWTRANSGTWINIDRSFFLDEDFELKESEYLEQVRNFFVASGVNLVRLPNLLIETVKEYLLGRVHILRPEDLRNCVLQNRSRLSWLSFEERIQLLEYILSDGNYDKLEGIELLPTDDNCFKVFNHEKETIFIENNENPKSLLPGFRGRFLNAPEKIKNALIEAIENERCK